MKHKDANPNPQYIMVRLSFGSKYFDARPIVLYCAVVCIGFSIVFWPHGLIIFQGLAAYWKCKCRMRKCIWLLMGFTRYAICLIEVQEGGSRQKENTICYRDCSNDLNSDEILILMSIWRSIKYNLILHFVCMCVKITFECTGNIINEKIEKSFIIIIF